MVNASFGGQNGTVSGSCTGAYVPVLTIQGNGGLTGKTIFNIHRAVGTSIYYKIDAYLSTHPSAVAIAAKAQTSVTTDVLDTTSIVVPYAVIVVSVMNNVGSNTYQIDYMTY